MSYEEIASLSGSIGLIFFIVLFAAVLVYALWPGNKRKFDDAARIPLKED
jgi:cytochrome c oxidase cbb3-type subunit 4